MEGLGSGTEDWKGVTESAPPKVIVVMDIRATVACGLLSKNTKSHKEPVLRTLKMETKSLLIPFLR